MLRIAREKKRIASVPVLALAALLLASCGHQASETADTSTDPDNPLTPFPYENSPDPSDDVLFESLKEAVATLEGPQNSRFDYVRMDLNGDDRKDALVYMKAPYSHWCGLYGCALLVMRAGMESFELVSEISPVRTPLVVSRGRSNEWRDIVVRVDGRWSKTRDVILKYDGKGYPKDPASQPEAPSRASSGGARIFP